MNYERPQELLKPVKRRIIALTFSLALILELLPLPLGSDRWLPDFVAMLILYWSLNQPRRVGIGLAFVIGLIADIVTTGLFGQHALAYSVIAYLVLLRQRQLIMYNLGQQTLVMLVLMLAAQLLLALARWLTGSTFPHPGFFAPPLVGAMLWPLLTKVMLLLYRRERN